ncbi:MAG: WD40 repeat domain-containing protein [Chloroflexota bacterium]|nr:WD40 repeat domain-containing protein [Chloroflexota bacterium]
MAQRNADDKRVVIGDVTGISGEVNIAGGDIYKGYTAEQVSVLLTQITSNFKPKPFDGRCPYKGLEVFEEEDADLFFGRERLVDDLISRVRESRTIFVTGPSGSGKSSLVRAGLLHSLKKGTLKGSEGWLYETMKPGREPLKELALAFSRLKSPELAGYFRAHADEVAVLHDCAESVLSARKDQRFVLFVDQFEEVFTQVGNEGERVAFLNMLAHAGTVEDGRVIVLFAMRSDFVSNCATYPALNELLSQEFRQIGAMQPEELVSAIALPARHVGLPIEDELIARIINDMKGEPGALPLMQFALKDLFDSQQAQGGLIALTLEDYLRHGGIHKSLERHADSSFARLSEGEQELARSIFSGLIEIGRGTQDTRRTALFDELIPAHARSEDVEAIVRKLADARLIITDEQAGKDTVTISHEKLIDAWPWLKKLVNENRDVIALQNEIASDAKEWEDHGRDPSYLYTGARLVNAREQVQKRKLVLSGLAQEFVQAGHGRQRRGQVSLISAIGAVIVLLVVAVLIFGRQSAENRALAEEAQAASTMAIAQQGTAQANAEEAEYQARSAQSMAWRERNLPLALLLGVEVFRHEDNAQNRGLLLDNVQFNPQLLQFLRGHSDEVHAVAFSADGNILASGSADGTIFLWDANTYAPIGEPLRVDTASVLSLAFSPDGHTLASGRDDNTILLWDVNLHEPIGQPLRGHTGSVLSLAFNSDGSQLASASMDGNIVLWDMTLHEPAGPPMAGHSAAVQSIVFQPGGELLASGSSDRSILLWDLRTGNPLDPPLTGHRGAVESLAFSPDGTLLASGSVDTTSLLWDMATRTPLGQPLRGHDGTITGLSLSPDGKILASSSTDQTLLLWNLETSDRIGLPLRGHSGVVSSVVFNPDGSRLASSGLDRTVILWDVAAEQRISTSFRPGAGSVNSVTFHPAGDIVALGTYNGTVTLLDVQTWQRVGQPLRWQGADLGSIRQVAFSPDGGLLAAGSDANGIVLWDTATWQPIGQPLFREQERVTSLAFSPDGQVLVSGTREGAIMRWDMNTYQPAASGLLAHDGAVYSVAFSPSGDILASAGADGIVYFWDTESWQLLGEPLSGHTEAVISVNFSPDGEILASGSADDSIILWNVRTQEPMGEPLRGATSAVSSVAFSPDGQMLGAAVYDQTVMLWDVKAQQSIGQPLSGHIGSVLSVAFSPDGKMLASGSLDNSVILWDLDPASWVEKSCQRAGRNFSALEWGQFFSGQDYRMTCEQWPVEVDVPPAASPVP